VLAGSQNIEIELTEMDGIIECRIRNANKNNAVTFNKADILKSKSVNTVIQRLTSLSKEIGKLSSFRIEQYPTSIVSLQIPFKVTIN